MGDAFVSLARQSLTFISFKLFAMVLNSIAYVSQSQASLTLQTQKNTQKHSLKCKTDCFSKYYIAPLYSHPLQYVALPKPQLHSLCSD